MLAYVSKWRLIRLISGARERLSPRRSVKRTIVPVTPPPPPPPPPPPTLPVFPPPRRVKFVDCYHGKWQILCTKLSQVGLSLASQTLSAQRRLLSVSARMPHTENDWRCAERARLTRLGRPRGAILTIPH